MIIRTLPSTKTILLPIFYIVLFYSIVGMFLFGGALYNRCRLTEEPIVFEDGSYDWPVDPDDLKLCGPRQCATGYCGNPRDTPGVIPNKKEYDIPVLFYGLINFDSIIGSLFSVIHYCAIS